MKFKTQGRMRSSPNFKVDADVHPIGIDSTIAGSFEGGVSAIAASIGEIPVKVAIPFLKRKEKTLIASIGGFKIKLNPFHIKVDNAKVHVKGTLGPDGIKGRLDCQVACRTDVDMSGEVTGKPGIFKLDLGEEEQAYKDKDGGEDACG